MSCQCRDFPQSYVVILLAIATTNSFTTFYRLDPYFLLIFFFFNIVVLLINAAKEYIHDVTIHLSKSNINQLIMLPIVVHTHQLD